MNYLHSPLGDNTDAAEEMPSAPFVTVVLSFALIMLVVTGLIAAAIYGMGY